jgi:hypothetical protein
MSETQVRLSMIFCLGAAASSNTRERSATINEWAVVGAIWPEETCGWDQDSRVGAIWPEETCGWDQDSSQGGSHRGYRVDLAGGGVALDGAVAHPYHAQVIGAGATLHLGFRQFARPLIGFA